jgi:hypothetical protein
MATDDKFHARGGDGGKCRCRIWKIDTAALSITEYEVIEPIAAKLQEKK